jgi:cardiolipin synthase
MSLFSAPAVRKVAAFPFLAAALFFCWSEFPEYAEYRAGIERLSGVSVSRERNDRISEPKVSNPAVPASFELPESLETVLVGPNGEIKKRLVRLISEASGSVDVSVYLLSDQDVTDALIEASRRGITVRAILERDVYLIPNANRKTKDRLFAAEIPVVAAKDDPFAFTHAKYLVADRSKYVLSTGNYAKTSFSKNREFFIFGEDGETAAFLSAVFAADFHGLPFRGAVPDRLYLAPLDARAKILSFLSGATRSIRVLAPSLSDPEILSVLSKKSAEGVDVAVCVQSSSVSDTASPGGVEISESIKITKSSGPTLHAKTILVDDSRLLVGSANFTKNSIDRNREVGFFRTGSGDIRTYETTLEADCKW